MSFVAIPAFRACQRHCPAIVNMFPKMPSARPTYMIQHPSNIKLLHLTSLQFKKNSKAKAPTKKKENNALDKFLDELSDDEEEAEVAEENQKRQVRMDHDSPVNKFLTSKSKGTKSKATGVTYADVCEVTDIDQFWEDMDSVLHELQQHFIHHVSLR